MLRELCPAAVASLVGIVRGQRNIFVCRCNANLSGCHPDGGGAKPPPVEVTHKRTDEGFNKAKKNS